MTPFTFYHLLLGEKPHHFKNCLRTAEQTCPSDWNVTHHPTFWRGEKSQILERLKADDLNYGEADCTFLPDSLWGLGRFFRSIQHGPNALIIHGVPHRLFWFVLRTAPALLSRTAWIGWGAGVVNPWKQRESGMSPVKRLWFSPYNYCVPRLAVVSTQNTAEFGLLESMVGSLDNHFSARYLLQGIPESYQQRAEHRPLRLCVGHRAGPVISDYEETFEMLSRFPKQDLEVHVPLSYGELGVTPTVMEMGKKALGATFRPMTDFMSLQKYLDFLRNMDVLIMPFSNPQAGFNCTFGLAVGSKLFLRPENSYLQRYRDAGCHVFEFSELAEQSFETLAESLPESVQRANFAGTQLLLDNSRRSWHDVFSRLVPTSYQRAVAECAG